MAAGRQGHCATAATVKALILLRSLRDGHSRDALSQICNVRLEG
jgi:hypothetical protein